MHIYCTGEGSPTVVLNGASLDTVSDWVWVLPEVGKVTRVCAYDRAGLGWSDASPGAPDTVENALELHTLLQKAGIGGPYVPVGHSFGGLYARTFAGRYPDEVAGMALIEGTHPDFPARLGVPEVMPNSDPGMLAAGPYVARIGLFRVVSFIPVDANLPARQQAELKAYYSSRKVADHVKRLYDAFPAMLAQVRGAGDLGARPLVVVVGGASENASGTPGELQDEQVGLSSNGAKRIAAGADHVSLVRKQEHAAETSKAIIEVVEAVRTGRTLAK
jgi:pimeloyl-ACP methyl ester carboxylesterase